MTDKKLRTKLIEQIDNLYRGKGDWVGQIRGVVKTCDQATQLARAEERARVRGVIENTFTVYYRSIYSQDCSRNETKEDKSTEMIKLSDVIDLLSSLDKPVTKKE